MVIPTIGTVVIVPFPFSDLSQSKLRPAVIIADVGRGDWLLCQITSKAYADSQAIKIDNTDFSDGSLKLISYVRPSKLFTAHNSLFTSKIGRLKQETTQNIIQAVIKLLQAGMD